jgi:hypothetical protein
MEWIYFFLGAALALGLARLSQRERPNYILSTVTTLSDKILEKVNDEYDYLHSFMEFQQRQTEALEQMAEIIVMGDIAVTTYQANNKKKGGD